MTTDRGRNEFSSDAPLVCSRRAFGTWFAAGSLAGVLIRPSAVLAQTGDPADDTSFFAYVGARTTKERKARGNGLNVYKVDGSTGDWTHVQLVSDLVNPSFLTFDRSGEFLYTVHGDLSDVTAFSVDGKTGQLTRLNSAGTHGKNPVHLSIDLSNQFIVVANHITSTVALMLRHQDGSIGPVVDLVTMEGEIGPHRKEQPFAKPHQVEFDPSGRFIAVPDKGLDRVFVFQIDAASQRLKAVGEPVVAREGSGPRHIAFHPGGHLAYVINELDSSVASYRFDPETGALVPFQVISALPDSFTGNSRASEIAVSPDGRYVYASNRGNDSIVILSINQDTGRLSPVEWQESGGTTPRFFALDPSGGRLFVANEDSDTVVPFVVDRQTGTLERSGEGIQVGSPVCIVFKPSLR